MVKCSYTKKLMVERYTRELADTIVLNLMHKGERKKTDICFISGREIQKTVILCFLDVHFTRSTRILDLY
jgi:hypothetical protein